MTLRMVKRYEVARDANGDLYHSYEQLRQTLHGVLKYLKGKNVAESSQAQSGNQFAGTIERVYGDPLAYQAN
ncbi:conserved hypothetical protein [Ricinus communis]|uniref:Uncharacterized protein n=1 Tax=Ricinus communis TaxID=3988 RepID=B9S026_RICCO|nr:conserved hypothetical protein [Ricinus communis]